MKKSSTKTKTRRKAKSDGEKSDDEAKRRAEIEAKIRRRVALEEKAFRLVEKLLENPISEEFLIEAAQSIDHNHYADIVEERAIIKFCGYPLCTKTLTNVPKQKYHISTKTNKVYDITERKNFCSPQCYKASKFFEKQLSTTPVWLREDEPPVAIELLSIDSNSGSLGEVVFVSPRAELKAELSELDRIDGKYGSKNSRAKQLQATNKDADIADIYCKGEAIHRKTMAKSGVAAHKHTDVNADDETVAGSDRWPGARDRSGEDDGNEAAKQKGVDEPQDITDHREKSHETSNDDEQSEVSSDSVLIEDVARSISKLCIERSLKNLECLNAGQTMEQKDHTAMESVQLWKDGESSVQSREDDLGTGNPDGTSGIQSMEPLSIAIPSDESMVSPDINSGQPCFSVEADNSEPILVPSVASNEMKTAKGVGSGTSSGSLLSTAAEVVDGDEHSTTDLASRDNNDSVVDPEANSSTTLDSDDDVGDSGRTCLDATSKSNLLEKNQQGIDTVTTALDAVVKKATIIQEISEKPKVDCQETCNPEEKSSNSKPVLETVGLETKAMARCAASNKARMLAELLDRRDELLSNLKSSNGTNTEKENRAMSSRSSPSSFRLLQLIEDCSGREAGHSSPTSTGSFVEATPVNQPVPSSSGAISSGGSKPTKSAGTSSASYLANIQRASEERAKIRKGSSRAASARQSLKQRNGSPSEAKSQKQPKKKAKANILELIKQTLFEWRTEETSRFLSKDIRHAAAAEAQDKGRKYDLRLVGREYSGLLGDEVLDDDEDDDAGAPQGRLPTMSQLQADQIYAAKVMEFYGGSRQKKKKTTNGRIEENTEQVTDSDIVLPMVDSHSQMAHRRKIVLDKLNTVFPELLGPLQIAVTEVSTELRSLVNTFNLTNTNIILKPAEWTLIAYFLLHLLTLRCPNLKQAMHAEVATHYFKAMLLSLNISTSDVQQITEAMSSVAR